MNFKNWLKSKEINPDDIVKKIKSAWWRYGNYCGPGPKFSKTCKNLSSGDPLPRPENQLDAYCKNHDADYCNCGVGWSAALPGQGNGCSKEADRKFIYNLIMSRDYLPPEQKKIADIISTYFTHVKNIK